MKKKKKRKRRFIKNAVTSAKCTIWDNATLDPLTLNQRTTQKVTGGVGFLASGAVADVLTC